MLTQYLLTFNERCAIMYTDQTDMKTYKLKRMVKRNKEEMLLSFYLGILIFAAIVINL